MVDKASLADLINRRKEMRDWYWVWDSNHAVEENETAPRRRIQGTLRRATRQHDGA